MVALAGCVPNTKIIKSSIFGGGKFDSPEGDWEFVNKWCANSDNMRENDVSISRINTSCWQRKEWGLCCFIQNGSKDSPACETRHAGNEWNSYLQISVE